MVTVLGRTMKNHTSQVHDICVNIIFYCILQCIIAVGSNQVNLFDQNNLVKTSYVLEVEMIHISHL